MLKLYLLLWTAVVIICLNDTASGYEKSNGIDNILDGQQHYQDRQQDSYYANFPEYGNYAPISFRGLGEEDDYSARFADIGSISQNSDLATFTMINSRLVQTRNLVMTKYSNGIEIAKTISSSVNRNASCTLPLPSNDADERSQDLESDWLSKLDMELDKAKIVLKSDACSPKRQKRSYGRYDKCDSAVMLLRKMRNEISSDIIKGYIRIYCDTRTQQGYYRTKRSSLTKKGTFAGSSESQVDAISGSRFEVYRRKRAPEEGAEEGEPEEGAEEGEPEEGAVEGEPKEGAEEGEPEVGAVEEEEPEPVKPPKVKKPSEKKSPTLFPQASITDPDGFKVIENIPVRKDDQPVSCSDVLMLGNVTSGVYSLMDHRKESTKSFQAYCDMDQDDGGWTLILRRDAKYESHVTFNKSWSEYVEGFGNVAEEYWIGLDYLSRITATKDQMLYVIMKNQNGATKKAVYKTFIVGPETVDYELQVGRFYGTAGDSLAAHNRKRFTTYDRDNDDDPFVNCAQIYGSGWWFHGCFHANLHGAIGKTVGKKVSTGQRILWKTFDGLLNPLKTVEMKIRHRCF